MGGDAVHDAVAVAPPTEVQPHAVAAFVAQESWKSVALVFITEDGEENASIIEISQSFYEWRLL